MFRAGALFVAAALVAASTPIPVALQPPTISAGKQSQPVQNKGANEKQHAAPNERGTEERPFIVKTYQAPQSEREAEQDAEYRQRKAADQSIFLLAKWTLGITILQTLVFGLTLSVSAYVAIKQLRAYVSVTPVNLYEPSPGANTRAEFKITNYGETPAYNVRFLVGLIVLPHPLPADPPDRFVAVPNQVEPNLTIQKGADQISDAFFHTQKFEPEDFKLAIAGTTHRLYLMGIVHYRDAFRFRRKTRFATFVDGDELRRHIAAKPPKGPEVAQMNWIISASHNDSD